MPTRIDLLLGNFQETVKLLQTYMITGLGASAFFVLLATSSATEVQMQAPAVGSSLPVPTSIAIAIALAVAWATGAMATLLVDRARRLAEVIHEEDQGLLDAALSYPSVATLRSGGPRLFLALAPAVLLLVGSVSFWGMKFASYWPAVGLVALLLPHLVLAFELRSPIGGQHTHEWRG